MIEIIKEQGPLKEDGEPLRLYRKINEGLANERILTVENSIEYPALLVDISKAEMFTMDGVVEEYGNELLRQTAEFECYPMMYYYDPEDSQYKDTDLYHASAQTIISRFDKISASDVRANVRLDGTVPDIGLKLLKAVTLTLYSATDESLNDRPVTIVEHGTALSSIDLKYDQEGNRITELVAGIGDEYRNLTIRDAVLTLEAGAHANSDLPENGIVLLRVFVKEASLDLEYKQLVIKKWYPLGEKDPNNSIDTGLDWRVVKKTNRLNKPIDPSWANEYKEDTHYITHLYDEWRTDKGFDWVKWGISAPQLLAEKEERANYDSMGRGEAAFFFVNISEKLPIPEPLLIADAAYRIAINSYQDNFMNHIVEGYEAGGDDLDEDFAVQQMLYYAACGEVGHWYPNLKSEASRLQDHFERTGDFEPQLTYGHDMLLLFGKILDRLTPNLKKEPIIERMKLLQQMENEEIIERNARYQALHERNK